MTISVPRTAFLAVLLLAGIIWGPMAAQAQTEEGLYFPLTGHHLDDQFGFLSFWRAHEGERLLGYPIVEALEQDGTAIQYFERGRLERITLEDGTTQVRTGQIGVEYAEALWKRFPDAPPRRTASTGQTFENGHTLREPFLSFWQQAGGLEFFGMPLSEPLWETTERGRRQVQYFERGRLDRDPSLANTTAAIRVADLGKSLAQIKRLSLDAVPNQGYVSFGPSAPLPADYGYTPTPVPTAVPPPTAVPAPTAVPQQPAAAPVSSAPVTSNGSGKLIVVDISSQWLYAYEGEEQVFDAPVTTGRDGYNTPLGLYRVYAKLKVQTMRGSDDNGPWVVPNVPDVMYINGGVALHGTYWHNLFGSGVRVSHGCINLPLTSATWLYEWAPMGTPVRVVQ